MNEQAEVERKLEVGIQHTSLHHIDHDKGVITNIPIDNNSPDLVEYTERLLSDIKERNSKRSFEFRSETTEVFTAIKYMMDGDFEKADKITTERLLDVEKTTQSNMNKLGIEIQKGSLFQVTVNTEEDRQMIIIGKADHNDFLDASDLSVHKGLPWKKKIFKSFLLIANSEGEILKIMVSDTTNAITKYWWSDFLELSEVRTDKHNTKNFLDLIDKKVFNPIKKKFPADHTTLRNSVLGYFRANDAFDLDVLVNRIFKNYTPKNENLKIDEITEKVKSIPKKYELDSQFNIDKEEINKRAVNKVFLNEGMELVLRGAPDLSIIQPFEDKEGEKYIAIKTEEGFNRFQK